MSLPFKVTVELPLPAMFSTKHRYSPPSDAIKPTSVSLELLVTTILPLDIFIQENKFPGPPKAVQLKVALPL